MRVQRGWVTALGLVSALVAACGGGGGGGGGGPSQSIAKAGAPNGDGQTGTVATPLTDSIKVLVTEGGLPKAGATVTWSSTAAGSVLSPTSSVTDAQGLTASRFTLGQVAGAQTAQARLSGATGSPVTFNETATPGPATAFTKNAGDGQSAAINAVYAAPVSVKVADQFGNGIAGVTVNWAVQSGDATLGAATSNTSAAGVATVTVTAGATPGAVVVRATNGAVAGNLDFNLTVTLPPVLVTVGNTFFRSNNNNTQDPAVDTVVVGQPVRWNNTGGTHTVRSQGAPSFPSSGNLAGSGTSYTFTFTNVGTYQYDCAIHGSAMTGRVVVEP